VALVCEIMVRFQVMCKLLEIVTVLQGSKVIRNISVETTDGHNLYPLTDYHRFFPKIPSGFDCVYLAAYVTNITLCQMEIQALKPDISASVVCIFLAGLVQEFRRSI
jgi:hypothetical protein